MPSAEPLAYDAAAPPLRVRVARAAREGGARELFWRALAVTAFRRLTIYARALEAPAAAPVLPRLDVRLVEDAQQYRALRPDTAAAEVERRLAAGHVCAGAWLDGELVAVRWLSLRTAEVEYLDLEFALPPGTAYNYDAWTHPSARGGGINTALSVWCGRWLTDRGVDRLVTAILPENRGGRGIAAHVPTRPIGWVGCVRAGRARLPVRRLPDGVLGRPRRLPR